MVEEEYIRLIFGLKMKQIRNEIDLSLFGLAKKTGLSKSYLNEIEKGKKYPKRDKILLIAEALEVDYDSLVSLKLDKKLAPVGEILQSRILKEIPLEHFGIRESDLIDIISEAPTKVNTFISTLIEIAKNYSLTKESFYLAALRSYQESNNNYFEDLEKSVELFAKRYNLKLQNKIKSSELKDILIEEFGYSIVEEGLNKYVNNGLRSIYVPKKNTLIINNEMDDSQMSFIFAKELAYNFLELQDRLYTYPWIKFEHFDQVLNNFKASYFAGALIVPRKRLIKDFITFFKTEQWKSEKLHKIMKNYTLSPEMFYQRITNILPTHFGLKNLFFLRFSFNTETKEYEMDKELHITGLSEPHANTNNEHYCRRWAGLRALDEALKNKSIYFTSQISDYENSENEYVIFATASVDPFNEKNYRSITIGIKHNMELHQKITFLEKNEIPRIKVGVTCESCSIENCNERVAKPTNLIQKLKNLETEEIVRKIMNS